MSRDVIVQSRGLSTSNRCEETRIEQGIAADAGILTAIGIATAFGLLVVLMVVIALGRILSVRILAGEAQRAAKRAAEADAASRDKALAAVVGVAALLAGTAPAEIPAVKDG